MGGTPGGQQDLIRPMLATLARELPRDPAQWAAELKWDGMRALAYLSGGQMRLRSRAGHDVTPAYPELAGLAAAGNGRQMILDGEIVALGGGIRPSFSDLQRRIHVRQPAAALLAAVPVTYLAFDLLALSGRRLLASPYEQRRELLESLGLRQLPAVDVPPGFPGDGPAVLAVSRQHGLEGIVLKRLGSPYVPGRSALWLKIKHLHVVQVVIGGWIPRGAGRGEAIRSLLVGVPGPAGLMYRGQVGTGFTEPARQDLARRLAASALPRCPFAGSVPAGVAGRARWVLPLLAGEVGFTEQTPAGHFRHPVWRGLLPGPS